MKRSLWMVSVVVAGLGLAGCAKGFQSEQVLFGDVDDDIHLVESPRSVPAHDGHPMRVTLLLANDSSNAMNLQYRWFWVDAQGMPSHGSGDAVGGMGWSYVQVQPESRAMVTGTAPDTDAVDWTCEFRLAK
jgi:uncharacterized protein YcfL